MFSFLLVFLSSCFHFFRCFLVFSLLIAFAHFIVSSLFVRYLIFVLLLWMPWIWGSVFTLRHFSPYTPSCFYQVFPTAFCLEGCMACHWGLKNRPAPSVCLNHIMFGNYMIHRELCLKILSKYVPLVVKSLINFKHIS